MSTEPTPARRQYLALKARYPDAILWYRLGDFYEMFDEDARTAAAALRITLTSRSFGKHERVPMCGVPYHAQARYLARLVRQGFSVAICEQLSEPGHGLVDREVMRVVTPGTISEPELLRAAENNYLAAVARRNGVLGLAFVDVSTGEFCVAEATDEAAIGQEIERLRVAECLVEEQAALAHVPARHVRVLARAYWQSATCLERLRRHIGGPALHLAGCEERPAAQAAAGAILGYLETTNRGLLNVLQTLKPHALDDAVAIDPATSAILLGKAGGHEGGNLLHFLDRTQTAMGARLLARWLRRPLLDRAILDGRQRAIAALVADSARRAALRAALRPIGDLERLTARVGQERAAPAELHALAASLTAITGVREALGTPADQLLAEIGEALDPLLDIAAAIQAAVGEPGCERQIRPGYDTALDRLADQVRDAKGKLAALEAAERERTGIRSLKVAFNSVFGYYIEVTDANLARVPSDYVRKQTLAHTERFVTADLLRWEAALAAAQADLDARDRERFRALQAGITAEAPRILRTAEVLARLDVLCALADLAEERCFCRPELIDEPAIAITAGRHPLVEAALPPGAFIPNDCRLGGDDPRLAVITGPNMGGKSTYLRQVALIVYLAQIGSFVPAAAARLGLVDRVFARIGAHDDLAAGQSTFLLEMAETAAIARLATERSLVLLDEIGRGTTSADGQAIARAVAEHMHDVVGARTLFATHYYGLAHAAQHWPAACNLHVQAEEHEGRVVFLYRVAGGVADRSFALHVARMAGMPDAITTRAADLLAEVSEEAAHDRRQNGVNEDAEPVAAPRMLAEPRPLRPSEREPEADDLFEELLALDLASTTPMEALNALYTLQQRARTAAAHLRRGARGSLA